MQPDPTSKHLQGITDLVLLAKIKPGLIDALDSRTHASRLRALMRTLNTVRAGSREVSAVRPYSDSVERIQAILAFRLAIVENEQKLLLVVTFDRNWEAYMRLVWRDLGSLLDLIFCNCVDYRISRESGYADYVAWIRRHQVESDFLYVDGGLGSVTDANYLAKIERLHRASAPSAALDVQAAQLVADLPRETALAVAASQPSEAIVQGLTALSALHRLTDFYPPDRPDGRFLLRAAGDLLDEFKYDAWAAKLPPQAKAFLDARFKPQLDWFALRSTVAAPPPAPPPRLAYAPADVQGGIVESYPDIRHGCLLLLQVTDGQAQQARDFLGRLGVTTGQHKAGADGIYTNVAFTLNGLRRLGVAERELARLPKEFREGMEARAGLLGDFRGNHPRNWALPERHWFGGPAQAERPERVPLSMVDIAVQLRTRRGPLGYMDLADTAHPLHAAVRRYEAIPGLTLLAVQPMVRYAVGATLSREHFGFLDGYSQPVVQDEPTGTKWDDNVERGELLLGYRNGRTDEPAPADESALLDNGTFLVVRKLRQDVGAWNGFIEKAATATGLAATTVEAKLMGRDREGQPLAPGGSAADNDFDYAGDRNGAACPFQSHVRRANPRQRDNGASPVPRILRRGMSYGPRFDDDAAKERGLVFMAYNASIAEQFEVVQRWLSGGNSTRVHSGQADPLLGVAQAGEARVCRFQAGGAVYRVDPDDGGRGDKPFVRLEWGAYFFVPSIAALRKIAANEFAANPDGEAAREIDKGLAYIAALKDAEQRIGAASIGQWKAVLEDSSARLSGATAAVWAAIRARHQGVLRTEYGVLVASDALVREVYANVDGRYSVGGYAERMRDSIGPIYLGLDDGPAYHAAADRVNDAIAAITRQQAYDIAYPAVVQRLVQIASVAQAGGRTRWEVTVDAKELSDAALVALSKAWFGLPDAPEPDSAGPFFLVPGGWNSDWQPGTRPRCPVHFTAPSRYIFSPNPGAAVKQYGEQHGQALRTAVRDFVAARRAAPPAAVLSNAVFDLFADDDECARTIVGVMMGFLPTVEGTWRSVLNEWLEKDLLWTLQEALLGASGGGLDRAQTVLDAPLRRAMRKRPVPDMVWRTATVAHRLGGVDLVAGDKVVVGIGSATQEAGPGPDPDSVDAVFGGRRDGSPAAPRHACPGYEAAFGVLLGMLAALLEAGTPPATAPLPRFMLRPAPAPLTFTLSGRASAAMPAPPAAGAAPAPAAHASPSPST